VATSVDSVSSPEAKVSARMALLASICLPPFVAGLGTIAYAPFFPVIARDLGTTVPLLGQISAPTTLAAAVLGLLVGPIADRHGYRRILLIGLLGVVAGSLSVALAPSIAIMLVAMLIAAIGRAIVQPLSVAIAGSNLDEASRRRAISLVTAAVAGTAIVGLPVLTALADAFGWRIAFLALTALSVAVVLLAARVLPIDQPVDGAAIDVGTILRAYVPALHHSPTFGMIASSVLISTGMASIWTYLGAFLVEERHFSVAETGVAYAFVGGGLLAGSLLAGGRLGALPLRPLAIITVALFGPVGLSVFFLSAGTIVVLVSLAATTALVGIANVARTTLLLKETPAGRATTTTLNVTAQSIGHALGSAIGGLLLVLGGYQAIALGVLAFASVAAFLTWLSRPAREIVIPAPST
jgi:MFS transporter, DHA1 family, inner membrane transport protein